MAAPDTSPRLPAEIIDMIIDQLQFCPIHGPDTSPSCPHPSFADLLPSRLVSRTFNERLLPVLFHSLRLGPGHDTTLESATHSPSVKTTGEPLFQSTEHTRDPATRLRLLLQSPTPGRTPAAPLGLANYLVSLHITIHPILDRTHLTTPAAYFKQLRTTLPPLLKSLQTLEALHVDANYAGLAPENADSHYTNPSSGSGGSTGTSNGNGTGTIHPLQPGGSPIFVCRPQLRASLLLQECFTALIDGVRDARLARLERLQVGVPYEGGYGDFFERQGRAWVSYSGLSAGAPRLQRASVKLFNEVGDWTIMPVF